MGDIVRNCLSCAHFLEVGNYINSKEEEVIHGKCRRYPPQNSGMYKSATKVNTVKTNFPKVTGEDVCGEYKGLGRVSVN